MVHGSREQAEALKADTTAILASQGLRLSAAKTHITHVEKGFDFLGFRIQRRNRDGPRSLQLTRTASFIFGWMPQRTWKVPDSVKVMAVRLPGIWSPEHLFTAAVSSCLMTTFLAVAENFGLSFSNFSCKSKGKLEKVEGRYMMTEIILEPRCDFSGQVFLVLRREISPCVAAALVVPKVANLRILRYGQLGLEPR